MSIFIIGGWITTTRKIVDEVSKKVEDKFAETEILRQQSGKHWDARFNSLGQQLTESKTELHQVEIDLNQLKAQLPLVYLRRDDEHFMRLIDRLEVLTIKYQTLP